MTPLELEGKFFNDRLSSVMWKHSGKRKMKVYPGEQLNRIGTNPPSVMKLAHSAVRECYVYASHSKSSFYEQR